MLRGVEQGLSARHAEPAVCAVPAAAEDSWIIVASDGLNANEERGGGGGLSNEEASLYMLWLLCALLHMLCCACCA